MRPLSPTLLLSVLTVLTSAQPADPRTDYFFRFLGGSPTLHNQRLRDNTSATFISSPGAVRPPFNPADHFRRLASNASVPSSGAILTVVPTHPHPPPVPGYYGLSDAEGVRDAYRLISTYRVGDEGAGFKYTGWELRRQKGSGKVLLRYGGDADGEWRWIAVREGVPVFDENGEVEREGDKWVPWWVRPSGENAAVLAGWEYEVVDLELEVTRGSVNSGAPGGVEE
jgi:hypothetical protein